MNPLADWYAKMEEIRLALLARDFSTEERKKLANMGHAMADGSFPIVNRQDLMNALHAFGRASNKETAKAHIKKRAKALGLSGMLPEKWRS